MFDLKIRGKGAYLENIGYLVTLKKTSAMIIGSKDYQDYLQRKKKKKYGSIKYIEEVESIIDKRRTRENERLKLYRRKQRATQKIRRERNFIDLVFNGKRA